MLRGERVTLRALSREDLERVWAFNNDLEVELAGGGDPPMPQSLARLQADFERNVSSGGRDDANFAIDVDDVFVGFCRLANFDMTARTCELGIAIGDKEYWGRGYGSEALALILKYAFHYRNFRRVWLRVNGRNVRAQRAYLSCGFVEEGRLRQHVWSDGAYDDLLYMGILRDEWLARAG